MEVQKRLDQIKEEIDKLYDERRELLKQNSHWYIGIETIGDGNYWDEYYHRLGFITEETALKWQEEDPSEDVGWSGRYYYAVSEEEYTSFGEWYTLDRALQAMYPFPVYNLDGMETARKSIRAKITDVLNKLDIAYPSFRHIDEDIYLLED